MNKKSVKDQITDAVTAVKPKVRKFFGHVGQTLIIAGAMVIGFGIGSYTYILNKDKKVNPYDNVKNPHTISVAINDSDEMLIIDRTTGNYEVYSDSVGIMIFKLYAGKIYANQPNK